MIRKYLGLICLAVALQAGCTDSKDPVTRQRKNLKSDSPAVRAVAAEELGKAGPISRASLRPRPSAATLTTPPST